MISKWKVVFACILLSVGLLKRLTHAYTHPFLVPCAKVVKNQLSGERHMHVFACIYTFMHMFWHI